MSVAIRHRSESARQDKNQQDHDHNAKAAAGPVSPVGAVAPGWQGAEQHENKNDKQDGSEHGIDLQECGLRFLQARMTTVLA